MLAAGRTHQQHVWLLRSRSGSRAGASGAIPGATLLESTPHRPSCRSDARGPHLCGGRQGDLCAPRGRRQGSGTFVTRPSQVIESGLEVLESIQTIADRIGLKVKLGKWRTDIRLPQESEYNTLQIHPNDYILDVSRVIIAGDRPAAFLTDILPLDILKPEEVEKRFSGSILDLLLVKGTPKLMVARTDINAVTCTAQVARALGIQRGDALLYFSADLYTPDGRVVDISHSYFLPGYFNFHVVRRIGQQS